MANEVDIRLLNGRKLQDIDLRKNFDNFKSDTNNKLDELRDITDPFRVDIKLEPSVAEIGSKIDVELSWSYNKNVLKICHKTCKKLVFLQSFCIYRNN